MTRTHQGAAHRTAGFCFALLTVATSADASEYAYVPPVGAGREVAWLIDGIDTARARYVSGVGASWGTVSRSAGQATVVLDAPLSTFSVSADTDSCGFQYNQRRDVVRAVVRDLGGNALRGTSEVLESGTLTALDGCEAGTVTPFGSAEDAVVVNRVAMRARPSMDDVMPGARFAGISERPWTGEEGTLGVDIVTLWAGNTASFEASGNIVPARLDGQGWLQFDLGNLQRGYTRIAVEGVSGAETWMHAEWQGGVPQRVGSTFVAKPDPSAGFGGERQATRMWNSGLFSKTPVQLLYHLYAGGTGDRVQRDADGDFLTPITWAFDGANIVLTRSFGDLLGVRTWQPLRNKGKVRFVLESERFVFPDGSSEPRLAPRVNFYIDTGAAVAPTTAAPEVPATRTPHNR